MRCVLFNDCASRVGGKGVFRGGECQHLMCRLATTHLFSWASVSCVCFFFVKLCNICSSWFDVHCHAIPHDHPCWCLFAAHTVQQEISFRSFVLAVAVYWNTMHRFADTVRFRGTSCFSLRRCRCASGNVLAFMQTASMASIIVVGCHVPHWRRSSKLGARPRSGFATRFPNRNTSRLLGRGTV